MQPLSLGHAFPVEVMFPVGSPPFSPAAALRAGLGRGLPPLLSVAVGLGELVDELPLALRSPSSSP